MWAIENTRFVCVRISLEKIVHKNVEDLYIYIYIFHFTIAVYYVYEVYILENRLVSSFKYEYIYFHLIF